MTYLDVSRYQTDVDYEKASEGLDGVIIRAGYGKGTPDSSFLKHYNGFHSQKVPIGVYWFSYARTVAEAVNEAQYCVSAIHGKIIELPVCFDFEDNSVKYAKKSGIKITKQVATNIADAFLTTIEQNGYYAMLYANQNFLANYYSDTVNKYDLWFAYYPKKPILASPPRPCGIWQYGKGTRTGFSGEVDFDIAYKNYKKIIYDAGLNHLPIDNTLEWAKLTGILKEDEVNDTATKADIARMLYQYHFTFTPEDPKTISGLLGG